MDIAQPQEIIDFWFSDRVRPLRFAKNDDLDSEIKHKFLTTYDAASKDHASLYEENELSSLALVILLDQFPRNMFRDTGKAFATDMIAISIAKSAIDKGYDKLLGKEKSSFLYMPFMHSENIDEQNYCVELFASIGNEQGLDYAKRHKEIIAKFGRFPHRNKILGRESTEEELLFLQQPGSSF